MCPFPIRRSKTCFCHADPKRGRLEFWSLPAAKAAARELSKRHGRPLKLYRCGTCQRFHLRTVKEYCDRCHASYYGDAKRAYHTEEEAERVADLRGGGLRVYPCPHGNGYHLTHKVW